MAQKLSGLGVSQHLSAAKLPLLQDAPSLVTVQFAGEAEAIQLKQEVR